MKLEGRSTGRFKVKETSKTRKGENEDKGEPSRQKRNTTESKKRFRLCWSTRSQSTYEASDSPCKGGGKGAHPKNFELVQWENEPKVRKTLRQRELAVRRRVDHKPIFPTQKKKKLGGLAWARREEGLNSLTSSGNKAL